MERFNKALYFGFRKVRGTPRDGSRSSGDETSPGDNVIVSEINPMDYIDSCDVSVSPTGDDDGSDVFVNLDAFDMLGDFPDLEDVTKMMAKLAVQVNMKN